MFLIALKYGVEVRWVRVGFRVDFKVNIPVWIGETLVVHDFNVDTYIGLFQKHEGKI